MLSDEKQFDREEIEGKYIKTKPNRRFVMTDTFEIRLRIHDEAELYSPFDEERSTISDDAVDYIFRRY